MAEKRQKKQAAKAFEKDTFSKDKEVTGAKHTEHRQDNTFSAENHFHANMKPVSNLPRDANHGSHRRNGNFWSQRPEVGSLSGKGILKGKQFHAG